MGRQKVPIVSVPLDLEGEHKGGCHVGVILSSPGDAIEYQFFEVIIEPDGEVSPGFLELLKITTFA